MHVGTIVTRFVSFRVGSSTLYTLAVIRDSEIKSLSQIYSHREEKFTMKYITFFRGRLFRAFTRIRGFTFLRALHPGAK